MQTWLTGYKLKNRPYEILHILGEGGFGITYKAKNLVLDVPVVIKTPNSRLQRDKNYAKYLNNFVKEAKQLAKLGMNPHPHIVRVFDFFEEDNLPCIVMDYVPGNSLYDLVQMNGALSEAKALEYIRQIGSALSICHQRGIIHRDVHPNNILSHADSGKAILIDFGISGSAHTSRSNRSGNQAFAPWEQLISFGEQSSKTPQVDIYTLAASFYYLLTGDTPTPSLARKFNNDKLVEPKQHNPEISDRIDRAILKGMAIEPGDRPKTVKNWLEILNQPKSKPGLLVNPELTSKSKRTVNLKDAELPNAQMRSQQKVALPNSAEQINTNNQTIVNQIQNDTKVSNIDRIISPQPQKKLSFLLILSLLVAGLGISGIAGYQFISNRTEEPELETAEQNLGKLSERSQAKNNELDNLIQTLEAQYQAQEYQQCYDSATQKISIDKKVMSDWIGKCGLALASSKASANSFSSAISIADTIPKEASNYQEVEKNLNLWSENILQYATKKYKDGDLEEAIKITELISNNSSVKTQSADLINQWRGEQGKHQYIISNAQQALEKEKWQDAKQEAEKIPDEFISWKKQAQAIINTANYELNKLDLQARQQEQESQEEASQQELATQQEQEENQQEQISQEEEVSQQEQESQQEQASQEEEVSQQEQESQEEASQQEQEESQQEQVSIYKIKATDLINIDIFQVEEYSGDYPVSSDGSIVLPLVDNVYVEGLTLEEASDAIEEAYSTYLEKPIVTVKLVKAASSPDNQGLI